MLKEDKFLYEGEDGKFLTHYIKHNEPAQCPICKKGIQPKLLYGYSHNRAFWALYQCRACLRLFIKESTFNSSNESGTPIFHPNPPQQVIFSKYIYEVSPKFVDIYNQANTAESMGLDEVAGIGYRKSIEFLIKDYLVSTKVEEAKDGILKMPLGACITKYIDNLNIKKIASRAVWLGNDETHYIRKHEDKDISDLKVLIDLTVKWIEMELMTAEAIEDIQPK